MRKRVALIVAVILLISISVCAAVNFFSTTNNALESVNSSLQEQTGVLQNRIDDLQTQNTELKQKYESSESKASKLETELKIVSDEYNSLSNTVEALKIYVFSEFVSDEKNEEYRELNALFNFAFRDMYLFIDGEEWSFYNVDNESKFTVQEFFDPSDGSVQVSIQTYPDYATVTVHDFETSFTHTVSFKKATRAEQISFLTKFFS